MSIRWTVILWFLAALSGCVSNDRALLGRLQVGSAGGICSFFTSIFAGPGVARGRNEGHLKSSVEIASLFGPFGMKARISDWELAATGIGLEEYNAITYAPAALSLKKDTLVTVKMARERELVSDDEVRVYYRRLFSGDFLNADILVDSIEYGGMSLDEVRGQLWRWLGYTYDDYNLDYYLFSGNQNIVRKLYAARIITHKEAVYLLARWFLERPAYEPSMIDDLEYFEVISKTDADLLIKLELTYYEYFNTESAYRRVLIERHAFLYDSVRTKAKWPLTIPRQSKIKAIAPSLRNRYGDDYDPDEVITMASLVIPRPPEEYVGYDPRYAVSMNDGRRLSTTERLGRWGIGNILSAFSAAGGDTQTVYVFNRRLHSPANVFHVELVTSARKRGILSAVQHEQYIVATVDAGYCSSAIYQVAKRYNIPVLEKIVQSGICLNRIFVNGVPYQDYQVINRLADGTYSDRISNLLRSSLSSESKTNSAMTIDSAEKAGQISRSRSDALLAGHFYDVLEQLTIAAMLPRNLRGGWRMRSQRLEVERALYEYKASRAMEDFQNPDQMHLHPGRKPK